MSILTNILFFFLGLFGAFLVTVVVVPFIQWLLKKIDDRFTRAAPARNDDAGDKKNTVGPQR